MNMRFWVVFLVWLLISCNEIEDCVIASSQDYAIVQFFRSDTTIKTSKDVAFTGIFEQDSMFYLRSMSLDTSKDDTLKIIALPVNPADSVVGYYFFTDSVEYLLRLRYRKQLEIFYDECDPSFSYELEQVYSPNFDSIVLVRTALDRENPVNVEIYL